MKSPTQIFQMIYGKMRREWKIAKSICGLF